MITSGYGITYPHQRVVAGRKQDSVGKCRLLQGQRQERKPQCVRLSHHSRRNHSVKAVPAVLDVLLLDVRGDRLDHAVVLHRGEDLRGR
jgi:hypothetical protein